MLHTKWINWNAKPPIGNIDGTSKLHPNMCASHTENNTPLNKNHTWWHLRSFRIYWSNDSICPNLGCFDTDSRFVDLWESRCTCTVNKTISDFLIKNSGTYPCSNWLEMDKNFWYSHRACSMCFRVKGSPWNRGNTKPIALYTSSLVSRSNLANRSPFPLRVLPSSIPPKQMFAIPTNQT